MDLTVLTFEELKTLADSVEGFKYHPNSKEETLRKNLGEYLEEHPEAIDDTPEDETKKGAPELGNPADDTPEDETTPEGLVKIKADDARGVISSSVGKVDFGIDGIAEVTQEVAEHFCDKIPKGFNRC